VIQAAKRKARGYGKKHFKILFLKIVLDTFQASVYNLWFLLKKTGGLCINN
jgi:hypothetical protein